MNIRALLLFSCAAYLAVSSAQATPVTVNFVKAEGPDATPLTLPFLMNNAVDPVFIKFNIPDIATVARINSLTVNVSLYDDGDQGAESGRVQFVLPGDNLSLIQFTTLNGFTSGSPSVYSVPLCSCDLDQVLPALLDGNFRIRFSRDGGDFFVGAASIELDAELVPEPASFAFVASGMLGVVALLRRRQVTSV